MEFNLDEKKFLLKLARETLNSYLNKKKYYVNDSEINNKLKQKLGCFVTLTKGGNLRGCIGYIQPIKPLYLAVMDNVINAAFHDPRFPPLSIDEFKQILIEISILTVPKKLDYSSTNDLLLKLRKGIDGVIIKKGFYEATYLPQVWNELKTKKEFLSTLCLKAGLNIDCWKNDIDVYTYQAIYFNEKDLLHKNEHIV